MLTHDRCIPFKVVVFIQFCGFEGNIPAVNPFDFKIIIVDFIIENRVLVRILLLKIVRPCGAFCKI